MRALVVIPARGGSKGVPNKNIKILGGKPLIQYTVDAARAVFEDNCICVSTDSNEIKSVVENLGLRVPFLRPSELATDTASTYEVLLHAINWYETESTFDFDKVIVLQPTSPFRQPIDILNALELYDNNTQMVVSVNEAKANPYFNLFEENAEGFLVQSKTGDFTRRQDCPKVWQYNGAIYILRLSDLKKTSPGRFKAVKKYVMDHISSVDIDTPLDWKIAELLAGTNGKAL